MSETPDELQPETDAELAEAIEGEPDESDPAEHEDEPTPEPEPEPEPQGLTEKEIEQRFEKLSKENSRHASRVGEILSEDANDLIPCPLCSHFIAGLILPQMPPEEVVQGTLAALGRLPDAEYRAAEWAATCPACNGLGVVTTGSRVAGNEAVKCRDCNGSGFVVTKDASGVERAPTPPDANGEPGPIEGVNPDDPAVAELLARGYTVIPKLNLPAGA